MTGRPEEAVAEAETAQELDPLSLMIGTALGTVLYLARQYDRAVKVLEQVLEMDPSFAPARAFLAGSYVEVGLAGKAVRLMEDLAEHVPDKPKYMADLSCIHARAGNHGKAEELFEELKSISDQAYVPAYNMAQICACLGRKDEAFLYLDKVMDELFGVFLLKVDPLFDNLRSDLRFNELLRKAHLVE
jgi:tetratricopeptide (TPR) repeat protein